VIRSFRHRGLERFFKSGDTTGIQPKHVTRLRNILASLNTAGGPRDMALPGLNLHRLHKDRTYRLEDFWSVSVSGNYRVTFRFEGTVVVDVDYVDYH
jgi:toxin HigB-1